MLIYASIDAARAQMATQGEELWSQAVDNAAWAPRAAGAAPRRACPVRRGPGRPGVADLDRTRVTVSACDLGLTGYELETALRDDYGIAVEAADPLNVLLNVTYGDSRDDVAGFVAGHDRPGRAPPRRRRHRLRDAPVELAALHAPGHEPARRLLRQVRSRSRGAPPAA